MTMSQEPNQISNTMPDTISDTGPETAPGRHPQMIALHRIIPNMLTLMALIAGITSIQKAINGQFETAVLMLLAAAILDTLDGAAARALKSSSEFGAQLDSLSDFLAFGVAPSLILYEWVLDNDAGKLGWIATIALPVAAALRLARFNVAAKKAEDTPAWKKGYFSGVPSPAGAGLALLDALLPVPKGVRLLGVGLHSISQGEESAPKQLGLEI